MRTWIQFRVILIATIAIEVLAALCMAALGGCTTAPARVEAVWQLVNAVDAAQTFQIARQPERFSEQWAAPVIGAHPSERSVAAYMAGTAVLHYSCARLLQDRHPVAYGYFEAITLAISTRNVIVNSRLGIRPYKE